MKLLKYFSIIFLSTTFLSAQGENVASPNPCEILSKESKRHSVTPEKSFLDVEYISLDESKISLKNLVGPNDMAIVLNKYGSPSIYHQGRFIDFKRSGTLSIEKAVRRGYETSSEAIFLIQNAPEQAIARFNEFAKRMGDDGVLLDLGAGCVSNACKYFITEDGQVIDSKFYWQDSFLEGLLTKDLQDGKQDVKIVMLNGSTPEEFYNQQHQNAKRARRVMAAAGAFYLVFVQGPALFGLVSYLL